MIEPSRVLVLLVGLLAFASAPLSAAGRTHHAASAPHSRIAFVVSQGTDPNNAQFRIVSLRADGAGGAQQLVAGTRNFDPLCRSVDGRKILYHSDHEAPHEIFLYVANADGSHVQKVTEKEVTVLCDFGFSDRWLLLTTRKAWSNTIVRHDLKTGVEKTILKSADRFWLSPDGSKLLFVSGLTDLDPGCCYRLPRGRERLELLDLKTLKRRTLAGPLPRGRSFDLGHDESEINSSSGGWSANGKRIAYTIGPSIYADVNWAGRPQKPRRAHPFALYVQPVARGAARLVLRFSGGPPSIWWSPHGGKLLVCAQIRGRFVADGWERGCNGGGHGRDGRYFEPKSNGKLWLVDVPKRSARLVSRGKKLLFAQWAPSGGSYAFATTTKAYVARPARGPRLLASAPKPSWPDGGWLGWSPDGRYIGLGGCQIYLGLAVLDVPAGTTRVLFKERDGLYCSGQLWWR